MKKKKPKPVSKMTDAEFEEYLNSGGKKYDPASMMGRYAVMEEPEDAEEDEKERPKGK